MNVTNSIHDLMISTSSTVSKNAICDSLPVFYKKGSLCWNCPAENSCMKPKIGRISLPGSPTCAAAAFPKFALSIIFYHVDRVVKTVPVLNGITVNPAATNLTLNADLISTPTGGLLYCHPFYNYSISTISRSLIKSIGTMGVVKASKNNQIQHITLLFKNLNPLTIYSIFCYVTDALGNGIDLKTVLQYRLDVSTSCCRTIAFSTPPQSIVRNHLSTVSTQISISLSSYPDVGQLIVTPKLYYRGIPSSNVELFPSFINFLSDNKLKNSGGSFNILFNSNAPTGQYQLRLLVSGTASKQYSNFTQTSLELIENTSPLPPANLSSAIFSNGGGSVKVCFTGPTNYAKTILGDKGTTTSWKCSQVFTFPGDSYSSCIWTTSDCVSITFCGSNLCSKVPQRESIVFLEPNTPIYLKSKTIKSYCSAPTEVNCFSNNSPLGSGTTCESVCDKYQFSPTQSILCSRPLNPIQPQVFISATIPGGLCQSNLTIDATATTGHAGRNWLSVNWTVFDQDGVFDPIFTDYLNTFSLSKPIPVPFRPYFLLSTSFHLTLEVTNFLGQSSLTTIDVQSFNKTYTSPPHVAFEGAPFRKMYSYESFSASVLVTLPSCSGKVLNSAVSYTWKVYQGTQYISITSKSTDPSKMLLDAYTLTPGVTYYFHVIVTTDTGSSSATLEVLIAQGSVFVIIKGANSLAIPYDSPLTLDASLSIYEDAKPGENDLDLSWSCIITGVYDNSSSFSYGDSCNNTFLTNSFIVNSLVPISINTSKMDPNIQYSFTAASNLVSATTGQSVISATVDVQRRSRQLSFLPLVAITSTFKKFLPNKILKIHGAIQNIPSTSQLAAKWEIFDSKGNNIVLTDLTLTKDSSPLSYRNGSSYDFSISLKPNVLLPGNSYTFRLGASISFQSVDLMTYATLVVLANSPPSGGQFLISPQSGVGMETSFAFSASYWSDSPDDYPLFYSYFYSLTSSNSSSPQMSLGFSSQRSYLYSLLPSGMKSQSNLLFCVLQISDTFGASAIIKNNVTVLSSTTSNTQLSVDDVNATLSTGTSSSNFASIIQTINSLSSSMVVSDCEYAPDCAALNRDICFSTPHTCGGCVDGYVGLPIDSNLPCRVNDSSIVNTFNKTCVNDNDCLPFYVCGSHGRCDTPMKSCPSNSVDQCSSNGICEYYNINTGHNLTSCDAFDPYCSARCNCSHGFYGAACIMDKNYYNNRTITRELLCEALIIVANNSIPSTDLISLISSSLSFAFDPTEAILASGEELLTCLSVLEIISQQARHLDNGELWIVDEISAQQNILSIISKFLDYLQLLDRTTTKKGEEYYSVIDTIVTSLNSMLEALLSSINSQMVGGEIGYVLVSNGVRVLIQYSSINALENAVLHTPLTTADSKMGATSAKIILPPTGLKVCGDGAGDYVHLSVMEWGKSPYGAQNASEALVSRILRFSTVGSTEAPPEPPTSTTEVDTTYELWMYFTTPQINMSQPNCTLLNGGDICPCNATYYDDVSVKFSCTNLIDLCPNSIVNRRLFEEIVQQQQYNYELDTFHPQYWYNLNRRRLDFNYQGEADDDDGGATKVSEYGTLPAAVGRELANVLSSPSIFDLKRAIPILSSLSVVLFLIILALVLFSRWDMHDYVNMRYIKVSEQGNTNPTQDPSAAVSNAFSSGSLSFRELIKKNETMRSQTSFNNKVNSLVNLNSNNSNNNNNNSIININSNNNLGMNMKKLGSPLQQLSPKPSSSAIRDPMPWLSPDDSEDDDNNNNNNVDDDEGSVVSQNLTNSNSFGISFTISNNTWFPQTPVDIANIGESVTTFFDNALPPSSLLDTKNGWLRFIRAVIREHDWIRMFTYPSLREPRAIRFLIIATDVLLLLFLDSLFFGIYYADDGYCETLSGADGFTETDCLATQSPVQGVPKCQWKPGSQDCILRPPPSTIVFFMVITVIVTILTVIPSIILHMLLTDICPRRPHFKFLSFDDDDNDDFIAPIVTRKSELGMFLKGKDAETIHTSRQLERYAYMEYLTIEEEANLILAAAEATMSASLKSNPLPWRVDTLSSHKNYAINHAMELLGVYPDGTPVPLNWYQWLIFHTPRRRLEGKIRNVRNRTEPILNDLKMFVEGEEDCKDTLLIRNFILEQVSPFHRYALRREFFSVDDALPGYVDGRIWLMAWGIVILCWLFFTYWILQWAALYSGVTLDAWAYQIIFVFIQDIFFNEMIQIFIVHILVLEALRPQLRQIYYALNTVVLNKMTNVTETDRMQGNKEYFRIIQHLSPSCRAARRPECSELPSAQILMRVDDNDAAICMGNRNLNLGYIMSILFLIPTILALSHETIQEGFMEIILPTIFCCFLLANSYLLNISPYLLAAPYVAIALYLTYRYCYLLPSRHRKLLEGSLERASTGMEKHHLETNLNTESTWRNMNLNLGLIEKKMSYLNLNDQYKRQTFFGTIPEGQDETYSDYSDLGDSNLTGIQLPESIENMKVHPTRFKNFKYQEKYRKKSATHYVNKHIWHSESKVPRESLAAAESKNIEQFFDRAPRPESMKDVLPTRESMKRESMRRDSMRRSHRIEEVDSPDDELTNQNIASYRASNRHLKHQLTARTNTFTSDERESIVHSFSNADVVSVSPTASDADRSHFSFPSYRMDDSISPTSHHQQRDSLVTPRRQKKLTARDAWKLKDQHLSFDISKKET